MARIFHRRQREGSSRWCYYDWHLRLSGGRQHFWFVPRYEVGGLRHRFFTDLVYATNGWLGVAFFGGCGAFFLPHWLAALRRVATTEPALQIGDDSLTVHASFRQKLRSIRFSQVKNLLVTTEGVAMSSGLGLCAMRLG